MTGRDTAKASVDRLALIIEELQERGVMPDPVPPDEWVRWCEVAATLATIATFLSLEFNYDPAGRKPYESAR